MADLLKEPTLRLAYPAFPELAFAGLMSLGPTSCTGRAPTPTATTYDSVGVQVVTYEADAVHNAPIRQLSPVPILDLGAAEADSNSTFFQIRSVVPFPDGGFAVANGGTAQVRLFDQAGRPVRTLGRFGAGPGEFRVLGWAAAARGDSILVYDPQQQRLTQFPHEGTARTFQLDLPEIQFPLARALLADGSILAEPQQTSTPASSRGVHRDTLVLYRVLAEHHPPEVFLRIPGEDRFVLPSPTGVRSAPLAFGRRLLTAVDDSGLYVGGTDTYEIRAVTLGGRIRRILRVHQPPRPLSPALIATNRERELSRIVGQEWQQFFRQLFDSMTYPTVVPAFSALCVDDKERLWVRDYPAAEDSLVSWTVYGAHGALLWRVPMPARLEVQAIANERVFGVWRDSEDVEHVRVYVLRPPVAGP